MKLKNFFTTFCAALASLALFAPAAKATLPYNNGDLILGFRASGGAGLSTNYEVNVGNATVFASAAGVVTLDATSIGNIKADLDGIFGIDAWSTRGDVFWSISGVVQAAENGFADNTMFATRERADVGTQSTPWPRPSAFNGAPANSMFGMASPSFGYAAGTNTEAKQTESTNNPGRGLIQDSSGLNCYGSYQPGGLNSPGATAFGYFSAPNGHGIEGTFANGTAGTVLDFYKVAPGSGASVLLGTFTINDNAVVTFTPASVAPAPGVLAFSAATFTGPEVDALSAPSVVPVTFTRTAGTSGAVTADLTVTGGSLGNGTDYVTIASPTTVSFANGVNTATVNIQLNAIPTGSLPGTIVLGLSNPTGGATLGATTSATVTINPVNANVHFTSATYSGSEAIAGGQIAVGITRDGNTSKAVTVNFSTANGTAMAGTDYTAQTDTLVSFAAGQSTQSVLVDVADVAGFQGSRAFSVSLTSPSAGAVVTAPTTATVTITDDEVAPLPAVLAFTTGAFKFTPLNAQAAPNNLAITLTRTGRLTGAVAVDVTVSGGTLTIGTDYTFTSPTTVNFADGVTSATIHIQLNAIAASKLPGTINLTLGNPGSGASLGAQTAALVTITRPDLTRPKVIATSPRADAAVATPFTLTGKALDAVGIDRVEVVLNGGAVQLATLGTFTKGKVTYTLSGLQPENGKNTLAITAVDTSGNRSSVLHLSIKYFNRRPEFAGGYNGLLVPAVAPSHSLSGLLNLKVGVTGTFTGNVLLNGFKVPLKGIFGNDGTAHFKLGTSLALVGKPGAVALGSLELSVATDLVLGAKVTGTLKSDPATVTANVSAPRNFFDGLTPGTTVDTRYTQQNKGKYTVVLPSKAQGATPTSDFPQGDAYANLTLNGTGTVKITGKLADGTGFSASAKLAGDYSWPLYAAFLRGKGSLAGVASFDDAQADSDLSGSNLLWFRPAAVSKYYPAGWPAGLQIDLLGAKYIVPVGASILPGLGLTDPANGNATLALSDGKLTGPLSKNVNIDPANVVTNAPTTDKTFLLKLNKKNGQISGNFTHTDLTRPTFSGILLQKGANAGGYGFFLSIVPSGATGESGGVSLEAK